MKSTESSGSALLRECVDFVLAEAGADIDEMTVERAVFGLFYTGVKLSAGHGGLCFTPVKEMPEAVCCPSSARAMPYAGRLTGRSVRTYIDDIFDQNPLKKAMGISVLNAVSSYVMERKPGRWKYETGGAFDALNITEKTRAVVVGALVPAMRRLRKEGADWTVLELDTRTLKGDELDHYLPPERADEVVPDADTLIITGVTILNDTLEGILAMANKDAEVLVTGPTVSMLPDVLFEHGVTMTGGIIVTDADRTLDLIAEGGSGYHIFGKSAERIIIRKSAK